MAEADNQNIANGRIIFARQGIRRRLGAKAVIRNSRQGRIGGEVIDISEHGCKLNLFDCSIEPGQRLTVKLGNMESWGGSVRWVNGQIAGVQFDLPLHSAVVDHLAKSNLVVEFS